MFDAHLAAGARIPAGLGRDNTGTTARTPATGPGSTDHYYTLLGPDRVPYRSETPGTLGGHRRLRIYGRLDCPSAARAITRGHYVAHRVFFRDEHAAVTAGYRPCAVCLPQSFATWKHGTTTRHRAVEQRGRTVCHSDRKEPVR